MHAPLNQDTMRQGDADDVNVTLMSLHVLRFISAMWLGRARRTYPHARAREGKRAYASMDP